MGPGADYWAARPDPGLPAAPELGANGFALTPQPAAGPAQHIGSRWHGDSITLNGWWRVIVTVGLLLPVVWMIFFMGIGGVLFLALYLVVFLPMALRDVWRRTQISKPPLPPERR